jgi:hypothetical protein
MNYFYRDSCCFRGSDSSPTVIRTVRRPENLQSFLADARQPLGEERQTTDQVRGSESMPDNLWERRGRLQIRLEDQRGGQTTSEEGGA